MSLRDWIEAFDLGCPNLKYSESKASWIALNNDPCPTCKNKECPNAGVSFYNSDRLIIVGDEKPNV